jgi:hypothetical protein
MFRKQFYFVVSGLKITGHRNPDNNLESRCKMENENRTVSKRKKKRKEVTIDKEKN